MYTIYLNDTPHEFEKQNIVTITTVKGSHDVLKCSLCGIQGKTTSLSTVGMKGSYSKNKIENCIKTKKNSQEAEGKKIQITKCNAFGKHFMNLTPGSEHSVVKCPEEYTEDSKSIWVMGVGEPVKILNNEFNYI